MMLSVEPWSAATQSCGIVVTFVEPMAVSLAGSPNARPVANEVLVVTQCLRFSSAELPGRC